jgi:aspartate/methionine/tyrosine aminotransferase
MATHNAGLPSLRTELAAHYERLHGVTLDPETEIVVTASGLQALHLALRAVIDPGDEVLVLSPAWPNGSNIIELSHGIEPTRLGGDSGGAAPASGLLPCTRHVVDLRRGV